MARITVIDGKARPMTSDEEAEQDVLESAEVERVAEYEATTKYMDDRRRSYPLIGDQLDALWKGGQAEIDMKALIAAVKAAHPKP